MRSRMLKSRVVDPTIVANQQRLKALVSAWYVARDAAISDLGYAARYGIPPIMARRNARIARELFVAFTEPSYQPNRAELA